MFKFGTEQRLKDVEMCAKFGSKKSKASRVISRFRRFVICGISFRRLVICGISLIFGTLFHINKKLLCAKFGLLKRISSGDYKDFEFFQQGLASSFT